MIIEALFSYVFNQLFLYQTVATLTSFFIIRIACFIKRRQRRYQLLKYYGIPGPEPRLLDGSLGMYQKEHFYADDKLHAKYGEVYGIFIGDEPILITTNLDTLKEVFFNKSSSFKERMLSYIDCPLSNSLLLARHDRWKFMRKLMSPEFNSYKVRGDDSTKFIENAIELMLKYLDSRLNQKDASGQVVDIDLHSLMKSTALHMISDMAIKLPNIQVREKEDYVEKLDEFIDKCDSGIVIQAIRFPFLRSILSFIANNYDYDKTLKLIRRGLNKSIDDSCSPSYKVDLRQQSLLDAMIRLYHEGKLTREEVIGNSEAILMAGYDTTSTTLTYIFWVLSKFPEVQEKLRSDLIAHGIESKYLEMVINETMRLYPTVISFTTRSCTENVEINGLFIPQGCRVVYNTWLINRSPKLWSAPLEFDPERFRNTKDIHPCAFAPFGMGERKCIGYHLAILEMKMVTCDILMRYKLKLVCPGELELTTSASVLTKPKEKVIVSFERL